MLTLTAKPVVESIKAQLKDRVQVFREKHHRAPKLSVVLVGEDPASVIYTSKKTKEAAQIGMESENINLSASATPEEVRTIINRLNRDPNVDGILIQRPLPKTFREEDVVYWVSPEKDVDAFHPENIGRLVLGLPAFRSCTPAGVMEMLKHYNIPVAGKTACVIGRSSIVGKPMAALLLQSNATLIQCHTKTRDMRELASQADILVVAAGKPGLVDGSYVKQGAVVIDVGIHRTPEGRVVGDVLFENASKKASAITPVPGGVGPLTIAMLLSNTVWAAEQRALRS